MGFADAIRKLIGDGQARDLARRWVAWTYRSGHREQFTAALRPLVASMEGTVIDVGGGRDSPLASSFNASCLRIRVDISQEFRPDICADGDRLPLATGSAKAILASEVLEHVFDPLAVLEESFRVLEPGGQIVGSVPFLAQGLHADPHDYFRYTDQALKCLLGGFEDVDIRPHGNGLGIAWRMTLGHFRFLQPMNPLMRRLSKRTDHRVPEGYTFSARKPPESISSNLSVAGDPDPGTET